MWLYNSHLWIKLWYCHRSFWAVWVALLAFHQVATQRSNVVFIKKSTLCPDNPDCFLSLNLWEYFFLIYLATLGLVSSANLCTFRVLVTALWAWHTLREEIFFSLIYSVWVNKTWCNFIRLYQQCCCAI